MRTVRVVPDIHPDAGAISWSKAVLAGGGFNVGNKEKRGKKGGKSEAKIQARPAIMDNTQLHITNFLVLITTTSNYQKPGCCGLEI